MRRLLTAFFILAIAVAAFGQQKYSIEQYLSIRSASSPNLSADGKVLFYLTNTSGTSQVWSIALPAGKPKQLTNYDDNVGFVKLSPIGDEIAFGKARGGDENTQLFVMKPDGSGVRALTDSPKVRHNFGGWSADGSKIYYASNKRNPRYFDVYRMEVSSGKEELVYQFDGDNSFVAVDPFERQIVVSRGGTELSLDNNLYLVDLATKKDTLITPHTEASEFGGAHFLPDGLVLSQNDKREFQSLTKIELKNAANKSDWSDANRHVRILDDVKADVEDIEISNATGKVAYAINRDGFSEIFLTKFETNGKPLITVFPTTGETLTIAGKAARLTMRGVIGGLDFSNDGRKLAFTFSNANHNTDIWLYDLETKTVSQVTKSDRSGIDQSSFVTPSLIKYKSFDGLEIPAWYYVPATKTNTARLPVIVSVHGGPEGQSRPGFDALSQYYVSRGYAVLVPNVRGSTGYGKTFTHLDDVRKREDSVKDLAASVEWLKTKGNADGKRIAVMGGSYGGYMTMAAITLYPELWAAAVDTVGIVNWETFLKNTSAYRRRAREVEYGMLDRDLDFLRSISPIAKVDKIKTPLFVIHGKNDPRVPYTEAEQVVKALRDRGATVEYKLFDDEGHGISKLKNRLVLYPLVADFLDRNMKP